MNVGQQGTSSVAGSCLFLSDPGRDSNPMCPSKEFLLDGVPGALGVLPLCLQAVHAVLTAVLAGDNSHTHMIPKHLRMMRMC